MYSMNSEYVEYETDNALVLFSESKVYSATKYTIQTFRQVMRSDF